MPAGPIRRTGYQGTRIRQLSPDVFADNQPLGSDRLPHLEAAIPTGSITADKLAPGVMSTDQDPGFGRTSGTLPLPTFTSGLARQIDIGKDAFLSVPFTITGGGSGTATVTALIEISPDNVTFTSAGTWTWPDFGGGAARTGIIFLVALFVPKSWWVKFTTSGISIGTGLWY